MEEILICNECLTPANDHVKVDCQHTYCRLCAIRLVTVGYVTTQSMSVFLCPICKTKTELPDDQQFTSNEPLNRLVGNFINNRLVDVKLLQGNRAHQDGQVGWKQAKYKRC